ncbi:YezD family protein [Altererythrobacter fulvus]
MEEGLASVREALSGLRFGSVSITVHEGRVVQIDVTEKRRLVPS